MRPNGYFMLSWHEHDRPDGAQDFPPLQATAHDLDQGQGQSHREDGDRRVCKRGGECRGERDHEHTCGKRAAGDRLMGHAAQSILILEDGRIISNA